MDKRTFTALLVCMVALFGVQMIVNKIWPPHPKAVKPVASTNAAPVEAAVAPMTATNIVETIQAATSVVERAAEQIVVLTNADLRVEFTSWGGGIKSIELINHRANGRSNTVLNGGPVQPALTLVDVPGAGATDSFSLQQIDPQTVVMRGGGVTKTVMIGSNHVLRGSIELPATATNLAINVGTAEPSSAKEIPTYLNVDWQGGPKFSERHLGKVTKRAASGENREAIQAHWVAVKSQYFVQVLSTETNATSVTYSPVGLPMWPEMPKSAATNGVTAVMRVPVMTGADGRATVAFTYYAGPKDYDALYALGRNQEEAMDLGSWMDFYSGIFGLMLLRSLNFFYGLIPSYGLAIVLVTLALKILFWPIQAKSIKSMKAMQQFQPHLAKLKEKYKDDAQRLNTETMKLYKEHGINPFAGCLPMLVQLPVLIAFYKVLVCDIALRGASFLWIKDLGFPDTVAVVAGFAINPLPLAMGVLMVVQQKLTPTTGDAQQAKMMMFMPLIMLFMFYSQASGLTLYWTFQQLLSLIQQWWSMRQDPKPGSTLMPATGKPR